MRERARRLTLVRADVRSVARPRVDVVAAYNYSFCVFKKRRDLMRYFHGARRSLRTGGLFFVTAFAGSRAMGTLTERTQRQLAGLQIIGTMALVFAFAALVLAAVGVFGVVAYGAKLRTREFGLRLALGATGAGIVRMMLRQNALLTLAGTAAVL